ncbi:MAG: 30S ribosomal protein S4 [Bdellovibrionota bacterium]
MARYIGPVCKVCRREGSKLYLKGERCYSDKCSFERKPATPGVQGVGRRIKKSEYGLQLREKQKVKYSYGLLEKQFRNQFFAADKAKGVTADTFFRGLELRLDNVVYRMGFGRSRNEARQLVRHNHIYVNGKKLNIPSAKVKVGDEITVKEKSRSMSGFELATELYGKRVPLPWFEVDHSKLTGKVTQSNER